MESKKVEKEIIDAILLAYDRFVAEILGKDPFPIDRNIIETKMEEYSFEVKIGDSSNHILIGIIYGNQKTISFRRENPIIADNLNGIFNFYYRNRMVSDFEYFTFPSIDIITAETVSVLKIMHKYKTGILGDIVKAMCNKIIWQDKNKRIKPNKYGLDFYINTTVNLIDVHGKYHDVQLHYYPKDSMFGNYAEEDEFLGDSNGFSRMPKRFIERFGISEITPKNLTKYSYTSYPKYNY